MRGTQGAKAGWYLFNFPSGFIFHSSRSAEPSAPIVSFGFCCWWTFLDRILIKFFLFFFSLFETKAENLHFCHNFNKKKTKKKLQAGRVRRHGNEKKTDIYAIKSWISSVAFSSMGCWRFLAGIIAIWTFVRNTKINNLKPEFATVEITGACRLFDFTLQI